MELNRRENLLAAGVESRKRMFAGIMRMKSRKILQSWENSGGENRCRKIPTYSGGNIYIYIVKLFFVTRPREDRNKKSENKRAFFSRLQNNDHRLEKDYAFTGDREEDYKSRVAGGGGGQLPRSLGGTKQKQKQRRVDRVWETGGGVLCWA